MATKHFENGIISTSASGDPLIYNDIFVTGAVYWVDSVTGNDANAGTNRNSPKATIGSALSAATDNNGDIIILESGHTETITSAITVSKSLSIFGLGTGTSKPRFTINGNVDCFDLTGNDIYVYNLYFPAGTAAHTARINVDSAGCRIENCDFQCGANDLLSITLTANALRTHIVGCTFTISADGPDCGVKVESAAAVGLRVDSCQFDGGSYDFDDAALYSAVAHTEFWYIDNTLTNKASIIHTAAAKGWCSGTIAGDTSRVEI